MMALIPTVLDASTVLDWLLTEGQHAQVDALLSATNERELLAPAHLPFEVTNALYQRTRRSRNVPISPYTAEQALTQFLSLALTYLNPADLFPRTLAFAQAHQLTSIYDTSYVVLAQIAGGEFWTGDRRLVNQLGGVAPWVHFIGDYPLP